ncbi:glycosyltransferase [bacterium]|nr:glycosyltransferase [bacterium]MDA7660289.1 glycosyltransferase [Verrucomicrobiota bacterium]
MIKKLPVSVITPCFNSEKTLDATIKSVLNQDFNDFEYFLIDDCSSTPECRDIIQHYASNDSRITPIFLDSNKGSGYSRNLCIEKSKGKYITFLDSDDIWLNTKLSTQIKIMNEFNTEISHGSYGYIDEIGNKLKKQYIVPSHPITYKMLLKNTSIGCLTAMYNSEKVGKMYMSLHRVKQDYALWLKILKKGYSSHPIESILGYYRIHNNSVTKNKAQMAMKHIAFLRETQKISTLLALYYTIHYAFNGLIKRL